MRGRLGRGEEGPFPSPTHLTGGRGGGWWSLRECSGDEEKNLLEKRGGGFWGAEIECIGRAPGGEGGGASMKEGCLEGGSIGLVWCL
jgi:hypothetical protein